MRILVSGSRSWSRPDVVAECLTILAREAAAAGDTEFVVVHGAAPFGADAQADAWIRTAEVFDSGVPYDDVPDEAIDCPLCAAAMARGTDCVVSRCPGYRGPLRSLVYRLTGGRRG